MRSTAVMILILTACGCGTTATICKKNGSVVEATIVRSDQSNIYLANGRTVARAEISEIDHPGDVLAVAGVIMSAVGLGVGMVGVIILNGPCEELCGLRDLVGGSMSGSGALLLAAGVYSAIWGWITFRDSSSAAEAPEEISGPMIAPIVMADGENTYYGIGMSWSW